MESMRCLLAVLILLFSTAGFAQDTADVSKRIAAVRVLLRERPDDPTLWFYLARYQAQAHDPKACTAALERVEALGDGFLPARDLGFANVWDDHAFQAVRARMEAKLPRLDFAPTAFELEDRGLLPEGIAYDAPSRDFFLGSLAEHSIVRVERGERGGRIRGRLRRARRDPRARDGRAAPHPLRGEHLGAHR